jgi:ATP-dependent 26S proteasome regulatory subunit
VRPVAELLALRPRPLVAKIDRAVALRLLERNLQIVTALCERALAEAWDSGRLAFGNEGPFPFAPEAAGILGLSSGKAKAQIETADTHLEAARQGLKADLQAMGVPVTPIGELLTEFGLDQSAMQILFVVAGPALWPELARLYAMLAANDQGRPIVDEMKVVELLRREGVSRYEIAAQLAPQAPLMRYGLVRQRDRTDRSRAFHELTVHPAVLARLRAEPASDEDGPASRIAGTCALESMALPAGLADEITAALARPARCLRLVLRGRRSSGRRTLVAALAARARRAAWCLDLALLPREPRPFIERLRQETEGIFLRGAIPCITGFESLPAAPGDALRAEVQQLFRQLPMPIAFRAPVDTDLPIDGDHVAFHLPPLDEGERARVWQAALARRGVAGDAAGLAARYAAGPGLIERAAQVAATSGATVDAAMAQHLDTRLARVAQRVTRLASWKDLVVPDEFLDSLRDLVGRVRHRRQVFEDWGLGRLVTTGRGVTALFQGGPGTGKTMVAGVLARELGLELYRIDVSRVLSRWLGETEKNLGEAFDAAEDGRVILLFDEADSLFARRTEVRSSTDRYANLEVNFLLQRLDSFEGIAILTSNFGHAIDPAFRRRLTAKLSFPFPDVEEREKLWLAHLPPDLPIADKLDVSHLARTYEMAGGYIKNCVLRAAFLAAESGGPVTQAIVVRAVELEFREGGKLSTKGKLE